MTSAEIREYADKMHAMHDKKYPPGKSAQFDAAIFAAEIAYQLAVMNERAVLVVEADTTMCPNCGHFGKWRESNHCVACGVVVRAR